MRTRHSCTNPLCKNLFTRSPSEVGGSTLLFCSVSCSTTYYNAIRQGSVLLRICKRVGCDNFIHSTNMRIHFCGGVCSRIWCRGLTSYTPESTITRIHSFTEIHGRIPTRNEMGGLNRLARRFFGSWNKAVIAAGYDPNPVRFANRCIARDGHICDSMAERIVDDWLYRRDIKHSIHTLYPWNNGMKCDFLVGDIWIEIFGLAGELERYDKLKEEKLQLTRKYKLKLIRLTLQDVYKNGIEKNLKSLINSVD